MSKLDREIGEFVNKMALKYNIRLGFTGTVDPKFYKYHKGNSAVGLSISIVDEGPCLGLNGEDIRYE